jgi:hypothetical protein
MNHGDSIFSRLISENSKLFLPQFGLTWSWMQILEFTRETSDSKIAQATTLYCFLYSGFSHSRKGIPSEQNRLLASTLNLLPTKKQPGKF